MQLNVKTLHRAFAVIGCLVAWAPALLAQDSAPVVRKHVHATPNTVHISFNSIQVFCPVNVRPSANGTGYGSSAVVFNSATISLNCPAPPIMASLSSTADSTGNLLVDNNINVTVTANGTVTGPSNVCIGGVDTSSVGPFESCFTTSYEGMASSIVGQDPDIYVASGGVSPISIASDLVQGTQLVKFDLLDEGGYLANTNVYLNTNCTMEGVTGPATAAGNSISASDPTPDELDQDFSFDPLTNQSIGLEYDLAAAQAAGSLTITDGTTPRVSDRPLEPATYQLAWAPQTSFATSRCLVHSGELLPSGKPACTLFTLECAVGAGNTASGAQCPVSALRNEAIQDVFDGPAFTLHDIQTPDGRTFHEGIGFLMASEGWDGGPCAFDPASGLEKLTCPQNLLVSFTGPGTFTGELRTTHPNSTFISIANVPEDLTTVWVKNESPNHWINTHTAKVKFVSHPPDLRGTNLWGADKFIPSPIASITYGISPRDGVPTPGAQVPTDVTVTNPEGCPTPTPANPGPSVAPAFRPEEQVLTGLGDGTFLLHYYAQDCAGTEELKFSKGSGGSWQTGFYTYPINVDTVPPSISGLTLSPAPSAQGYALGQVVTASYSCQDILSGVTLCGDSSYSSSPTHNTGTLTAQIDTSIPGPNTFFVLAMDEAGNLNWKSVNYKVK
jgi:hypothetical protein